MAATIVESRGADLALRRLTAGLPQQRRPRPPVQRVTLPRAPASPLVARIPTPPDNGEKLGFLQIGVLGWGSEGTAQAKELIKFLEGVSDMKLKVGMMGTTSSVSLATVIQEEDEILGGMRGIISESDVVCLLLPDMTGVRLPSHNEEALGYATILSLMKPHSILVVSGGFGQGHMQTLATDNHRNIIAVDVNPGEMGPFVRDLNIQARQINGGGTSFSLPVHQEDIPTFRWRDVGLHMMRVAESLVTLLKYREDRPFRWRDLGLHLMLGFIAGSFLVLMKYQGGAVAYSFSLILFWGAALCMFNHTGMLPRSWVIPLLSLISVAVFAMNMLSSSEVQPTGASGCPTLPCDGAQSCCSCDPAFPKSGVSQNGNVVINIWNLLSFRGFFLGNAGDRVILGH